MGLVVSLSERKRPLKGRRSGVVSPIVADYIAILITTGWIVLLMADIVVKDYSPAWYVHVTAGSVVGSIFGFRIATTKNGN